MFLVLVFLYYGMDVRTAALVLSGVALLAARGSVRSRVGMAIPELLNPSHS